MNNASGPQRIEVLELTGGELSYRMEQIEQIMGKMQQLLQAKSADGGQQKDESGGTGEANDDSGGVGRAPRQKGAAGARVGATTATAAGGRMFNHSTERRVDQDQLAT